MSWYTIKLGPEWSNGIRGHCTGQPDEANISRCAGFFAAVACKPEHVFAAVDRVRSIPLFYHWTGAHLYLGDDAHWVAQQVGRAVANPVGCTEFGFTGYVTGNQTLVADVLQLQAGEALSATRQGISLQRYTEFRHQEADGSELEDSFETAMLASIDALIAFAGGRQIVIPLSGGYDSRLILAMLVHRGYDNLIAFTFGPPSNREVAISREVAGELGVRWLFSPYSPQVWRDAFQSPERARYYRLASGLISLPHILDFPAVLALRDRFAADAIFVPGHSGDFICGGHIPPKARHGGSATAHDLIGSIAADHYNLRGQAGATFARQNAHRLLSASERAGVKDARTLADAYELWDWQERQAKYIVNAVRVYEFFGFAWWLPMWDKPFMDFWNQAPLAVRIDDDWYPDQVVRLTRRAGVTIGKKTERSTAGPRATSSAIRIGREISSAVPMLAGPVRQAKRAFSVRRDLNHPMMLGHAPYGRSQTLLKLVGGSRILGLYAEHFLATDPTLANTGRH
jgi:asparagine synthase (glutamine-hydrolysing)